MSAKAKMIKSSLLILSELGMPKQQQNERSALSLLAILNLAPGMKWSDASNPMMGITPIMDWIRTNYQKKYAPNTRETIRRQTMHQFVAAGIATYNPDKPTRPVNSPKAVYQIDSDTLTLIRAFDTKEWEPLLKKWKKKQGTLVGRYANARDQNKVSVIVSTDLTLKLTPGKHSDLMRSIIEEFGPRFVPGGTLVYAGDTGSKWGYFDAKLAKRLGVKVDSHGKMPDVILYHTSKKWLILAEAVTSHGPVDGKRHDELKKLFAKCKAGLVFVTAFPDRSTMVKYLRHIAWETEVWVADAPSHLIHFNGERFLGPY